LVRVAILDDYQRVALEMADWSGLPADVKVDSFPDHLADESLLVQRLKDYDVIIGMRERTPMPRSLLEQLPSLKLLITTGMGNASFDMAAATELGITVAGTQGGGAGTAELTWGLILSVARNIPREEANLRQGGWQQTIGPSLSGKTLGIVGLGRIGTAMARIGLAFDMKVLAWSQNLTRDRAEAAGAVYAGKDELFSSADFVTIHYVLSDRSRGMVSAREIGLMKPTAYLINTSRGPIVDERALIEALESGAIAGAALDVYNVEPLPIDHPFRGIENTVVTPHLGYVTVDSYRGMFKDAVENIQSFMLGDPTRVLNAAVLERPNLRKI